LFLDAEIVKPRGTARHAPDPAPRFRRLLAVVALLLACGHTDDAEQPLVVDGFDPIEGVHVVAGAIAFEDGARLSSISIDPDPLLPGTSLTVRFTVDGPTSRMRVGVRPPTDGGRQVALGGVGAPAPTLPADPRAAFLDVEGAGQMQARLDLPAPFHPRTAMITVERPGAPAIAGPRTRDGRAILALLDVQPTPTRAEAVRGTIAIDGILDDPAWADAPRHALTRSIDGEPVVLGARREGEPGLPPTEVTFAWDDRNLYIGAVLPDADIRGTFEAHDDELWKEEAFEVFVFGDAERTRYLELQLSPRGVTFDKRFTSHRQGDQAWTSSWITAVQVDGTIEHGKDRDTGWSLEAAIAWAEICEHTEVSCPPAPGATLRVNIFRLERPRKGDATALALSPTRVSDFHAPENSAVLELLP
jgi:hypothetical protein